MAIQPAVKRVVNSKWLTQMLIEFVAVQGLMYENKEKGPVEV